ncbi:MAG: hypothetical protein HY235_27795 [Acidobacteria bacterium]|nr:hypothetical protein [Acidobacteriota bacterium]
METVRRGSRGTAALMAQMLLNDRIRELPEQNGRPHQPLKEDGIFGEKSEKALLDFFSRGLRFSRQPVIDADTWRRLGLKVDIDHRVPLVGQKRGGLCWEAAAEMILGGRVSAGPGLASLDRRGALQADMANLKSFGDSYRWRYTAPTIDAAAFADLIHSRPIWVAGQGAAVNGQSFGHAVVVSGMWGDGDPNGSTALLRIHDPWPGPGGRIYSTRFFSMAGIRLPGGVWFRPQAMLIPN